MRRVVSTLGIVLVAVSALAEDAERAAVEAVVKTAYIDGVHARGDAALMRAGFHPDFRMLSLKDGALTATTLEEWATRVDKASKERKDPRPEIRHEFKVVDVAKDAAVVRLELHRAGKHVFTDYLSLYRFPDGWKIVGKTFQAH